MSKRRKYLMIILIVMIVATIGFIFSNSMQGQNDSAEFSGSVYSSFMAFVKAVFGKKFSVKFFTTVTHSVFRKLAHCTEFFILGVEVSCLYICIDRFKRTGMLETLGIGLVIGALDEIIQIFFDRGAAVTDVLLDFSGFAIAFLIVVLILWIVTEVKKKKLLKKTLKK